MKTLSKISILSIVLLLCFSCDEKQDNTNSADAEQKAYEEKIAATNNALFTAWSTGDVDVFEANITADLSRTQNGEQGPKNRKEYIELMQMFRTAIPDLKFTYELVAVEGNKTFSKWTGRGTNTGMFGDQPASGKSSVTNGFTILTFNEDGKAIMEEAYMDQLSYLQPWGYTLVPPTVE